VVDVVGGGFGDGWGNEVGCHIGWLVGWLRVSPSACKQYAIILHDCKLNRSKLDVPRFPE